MEGEVDSSFTDAPIFPGWLKYIDRYQSMTPNNWTCQVAFWPMVKVEHPADFGNAEDPIIKKKESFTI